MTTPLFPTARIVVKGLGLTDEQAQLHPVSQISVKGNDVINAKLFFGVTPVSFDPGQTAGQATIGININGKPIPWTQHEKIGGTGFDTSQMDKIRVYDFDVPILDVLKKPGRYIIQISSGYQVSNTDSPSTDPNPQTIWLDWSAPMILEITEALA